MAALTLACRTNESPEAQLNDDAIATSVKAKLASDLGAASVINISVNSTNGIVTLAGTVHNSGEKTKAVQIAQSVPKVARVNDNLQVMGGASAPSGSAP